MMAMITTLVTAAVHIIIFFQFIIISTTNLNHITCQAERMIDPLPFRLNQYNHHNRQQRRQRHQHHQLATIPTNVKSSQLQLQQQWNVERITKNKNKKNRYHDDDEFDDNDRHNVINNDGEFIKTKKEVKKSSKPSLLLMKNKNSNTKKRQHQKITSSSLLSSSSMIVKEKQKQQQKLSEVEGLERTTKTATTPIMKTRLGDLCESFRNVLIVYKHEHHHHEQHEQDYDIDIPKLIKACYHYEQIMKDIGHIQSAKDLHQNIQKVESFYNKIPQSSNNIGQTLKSILHYEKSFNIHKPNAVLKDPSCAMGLLWIRRSISFQCELYKLILEASSRSRTKSSSSKASTTTNINDNDNIDSNDNDNSDNNMIHITMKAYHKVLEPYHGYVFQKLYKAGIQYGATPKSFQLLLAQLGGFQYYHSEDEEEEVKILKNNNNNQKLTRRNNNNDDIHNNKAILTKTIKDKAASISTFGILEEMATLRDMNELVMIWEPLLKQLTKTFIELELEDLRKA